MDQVAEFETAGVLRALELDTALLVGVVEDELVVAVAAEFLAADAPLRALGDCRPS